jgi:hypothetical protein
MRYRASALLTGEFGFGAQIQLPPTATGPCGIALPPNDGDLQRNFDSTRASISVTSEARMVATPIASANGSLRIIGGGAWYLNRAVPAWLAGVGFRRRASFGAIILDVERWSVGVPYELERFRLGAPDESLGMRREWQAFWHLRLGVTVWSR